MTRIMRKYLLFLTVVLMAPFSMMSQGWPADYGGVVLQGFFWDSFRPADNQPGKTMATMYGAGWGENDEWEQIYKANFEDSSINAAEVMQEWYDALAVANGKK